MKKVVFPVILGLTLLGACQHVEPKVQDVKTVDENHQQTVEKKDNTVFPYPNLLAEDEQSYSLLVIGEQDEQAPIEDNAKITKDVKSILSLPTLEMANKIYPELELKSDLAYILFDQNGVIHLSSDLKDLTSYLEANRPKKK